MAELQFPNIVGQFLQQQQVGRAQAAADRKDQQQTRLGELAQLAYGATPEQRGQFVGEAVGINPDAGFALEKQLSSQDEAREARLLSTARLIAAAPEEQKGAIFAQVRPQIAQLLPGLPDTYNPQVGQGINAFIQSRTGAGKLDDRYRVVGGALVDLQNPTGAVYVAPQPQQIIEGAGGYFGVNRGTLQATPVQVGAPSMQPRMAPGEVPFSIDPTLPPEVQSAIRQNPQAFANAPDGSNINIPQSGGVPQLQPAPDRTPATWAPLSSDEIQGLGLPAGTVAQRNLQTGQVQTIRTPTAAQTTASQGRPLTQGTVNKLATDAGKLENLTQLRGSFKDDFAGSGVGGSVENFIGRNAPGFLDASTPGQAAWWQQYDRLKNEVRNELFGASLTAGEQAAFEAADITPNMDPKVLKQNLAKQSEIIKKGLERQAKTWAAQGYNREAIREASGVDVNGSAPSSNRPELPAGFSWED